MSIQELTAAKKETKGNSEAFLSGKLAQVDIGRIEKEIKELWKSAAEAESGAVHHSSVTRACAMNLILYSQDKDAESAAADVLDEITQRHPCRAILAICRDGDKPSLEAWVSARCHINDSKSRKQICCEQITVRSEKTSVGELASVVLPLLLADLPVYLWWRAGTISLDKVKPFLANVDEIIVDSAKNDMDSNFFSDVIAILGAHEKKYGSHVVVSDLNWRRCLAWREALALSFDESHGRVPVSALMGIKTVDITYAANNENVSNQALLYVGWLSSRLGWQTEAVEAKGELLNLTFSTKSSKVQVNLRGVECDANNACGNLTSVHVNFQDAAIPSIFIDCNSAAPGLQVDFKKNGNEKREDSEEGSFGIDPTTESRLIDLELENCDRDGILEAAYRQAAMIVAALNN